MPMRGCSAKAPPTPGGQAGWSTTNSTQPGPAPPLSPQSHARAGPAPERRRESPPPPRAPGLRSPPPPARRFTPLRPPPPSHIHTPPARLLYGKPRSLNTIGGSRGALHVSLEDSTHPAPCSLSHRPNKSAPALAGHRIGRLPMALSLPQEGRPPLELGTT
ncbi:basic salivary proline-rich protein 2-like isoform X6 [Suricata suricatta]|uniref:basic salivary proline-rich protein 2-like isoform X6 n=1 Tax=Suricata suricatta TaxID=37032 RepID=UPI001155B45F|nr:basic salivary proline-rich protein 2-like isoform X6 [Suricata suricatta]